VSISTAEILKSFAELLMTLGPLCEEGREGGIGGTEGKTSYPNLDHSFPTQTSLHKPPSLPPSLPPSPQNSGYCPHIFSGA